MMIDGTTETLRMVCVYRPTREDFRPGFTPAMATCRDPNLSHVTCGATCPACGFVNPNKVRAARRKAAK